MAGNTRRDPRALGRARRAARQSARGKSRVLPKAITGRSRRIAAQLAYATDVVEGREPYPANPNSLEARQLARMGSYARWGKADPRFEAAFAQYWYHDDKRPDAGNEADENYDYVEEDEEE